MEDGPDSFIILLLIGAGVYALFLVAVPPRIYRDAVRNVVEARGSRRLRASSTELRHFLDFAGGIFLIPMLFVTLVGGGIMVVHEYVARVPLIEDVVSAFSAEAQARELEWAMYMEEMGGFGSSYDSQMSATADAAGYDSELATRHLDRLGGERALASSFVGAAEDLVVRNWMSLAVLALLGGVFLYWFMFHYHAVGIERYHTGILQRRPLPRRRS